MNWTEYKSVADQKANRDGQPREGQRLSSAPGGYCRAVMPGGRCALIHRSRDRMGHERLWSLEGDNR